MTIPLERTRSVLQAEAFLKDLMVREDVPEDVRDSAKVLLRHYPTRLDLKMCVHGGNLVQFPFGDPDDLPTFNRGV